jgi:hypothetical protein
MDPNQQGSSNPHNNPPSPWQIPFYAGQPNPLFTGTPPQNPYIQAPYNPNPTFPQAYAQWGHPQPFTPPPQIPSDQGFPQTPLFEQADEVEVVPETQLSERAKKGRGKGKKPIDGTQDQEGRVNWSLDEELALVKAYIDVSEDPIIGKKIETYFFHLFL